jgi:hypothetical protein
VNQLIIHWICREDFGIERNQSPEKLSTVTHNSVFAAHRLKNAVPRLRDGIFLFLRAMQTLRMIIEMRTYKIKPGLRAEFLEIFESRSVPEHQKIGMKILGPFLSVEDADTFFFMRAFPDLESRDPLKAQFYEGKLWKEELEQKLMPMIEKYDVVVIEAKDGLGQWR